MIVKVGGGGEAHFPLLGKHFGWVMERISSMIEKICM